MITTGMIEEQDKVFRLPLLWMIGVREKMNINRICNNITCKKQMIKCNIGCRLLLIILEYSSTVDDNSRTERVVDIIQSTYLYYKNVMNLITDYIQT